MPKTDSSIVMLAVAAIVALGVGYYVPRTFNARPADEARASEGGVKVAGAATSAPTSAPGASAKSSLWIASAPGRIEPTGGEVRIGPQAPGRIAEILVGVNDKVQAGDLLMRLDDEDAQARVLAATAELAARKRERDAGDVANGTLARDRRVAEDNFANAERQLALAREELDRLLRARHAGSILGESDLDKARDSVTKAREKLDQARVVLRKALAAEGLIAPTRGEVALTAARAELSLAETALERTRIRAPAAGTVLLSYGQVGELVGPTSDLPLFVVGNLSQLRVRAEFEDRDLGKVRSGMTAVVRSDAFPGRDFEGKVTTVSPALTPSRLGQKGPRKPTDVDVLEVLISLSSQIPLLPGMRVDVFLKAEASQPAAAGPKLTSSASAH